MNPQEPITPNRPAALNQQSGTSPQPFLPETPHKSSRGKLIALVAISILLLGLVIIFMIGHSDDKKSDKNQSAGKKDAPTAFTATITKDAPTYAGNKVFDACSLLPFSVVQAAVPGFPTSITDNPGKRYTSPIAIAHSYIDRDITRALGKDGQARAMSQTISAAGGAGTTMTNFTSLLDVQCAYGQGQPMSTTFARVFVTQQPTSFAPEFLPFLATLPKTSMNGIDVYTVNTPDSDGFLYAALVRPDNKLAVIVKGGIADLMNTAAAEISKKMAAAPQGYTEYNYPGAYANLTNTCSLLTAGDFEKYTKKTATALAEEELLLTDSKKLGTERTCRRIEADRTAANIKDIAHSEVTLRQGKTSEAAVSYLETVKKDYNVTASKTKLGDESYVRSNQLTDKPDLSHTFVIRKDATLIELQITPNASGDTSAQAFEQRIAPAARSVYQKFLQQTGQR